jgi:hypothetical protein
MPEELLSQAGEIRPGDHLLLCIERRRIRRYVTAYNPFGSIRMSDSSLTGDVDTSIVPRKSKSVPPVPVLREIRDYDRMILIPRKASSPDKSFQ